MNKNNASAKHDRAVHTTRILELLKQRRYSRPINLPPSTSTILRDRKDGSDLAIANPITFRDRGFKGRDAFSTMLSFAGQETSEEVVDIAPAIWRYLDHKAGFVPFTGNLFHTAADPTHHVVDSASTGLYYLFLPEWNVKVGPLAPTITPVPVGYRVTIHDVEAAITRMFEFGWALGIYRSCLAWAIKHSDYKGQHLFNNFLDCTGYTRVFQNIFMTFGRRFTYVDNEFFSAPDVKTFRPGSLLTTTLSLLCSAIEVNDALSSLAILDAKDDGYRYKFYYHCGEVGRVYQPCYSSALKFKDFMSYGDMFDHVFSNLFGSSLFGDLITPLSTFALNDFIPRLDLYLWGGARLSVFNPRSAAVNGSFERVTVNVGGVEFLDEDAVASCFAYDFMHGYSFDLFGDPIPRSLFYCFKRGDIGNLLQDISFLQTGEPWVLSWLSDLALEPQLQWEDLCNLNYVGSNKKTLYQMVDDFQDVYSDGDLKDYCKSEEVKFKDKPMHQYLGGSCFTKAEMMAMHNDVLKLLPRNKAPSRPWPDEWPKDTIIDYEIWKEFKVAGSKIIACDDMDITMARRNFDCFDIYETMQQFNYPNEYVTLNGERFENGWCPRFVDVCRLFRLFYCYSTPETPYQVFTNWFFYCLRCETSWKYGTFLVRFGVLSLATSSAYKNFVSLHDYVVILTNRGLGLGIDATDCQGLLLGLIILGQWGPRRTAKFANELAHLDCVKGIVALMNDKSFPWINSVDKDGNPIPGTEDVHRQSFAAHSFDYIKSEILGGTHGDHGLVAKLKSHLDKIGCPYDDSMFRAPIGGCWIGAHTHLDGMMDLWASVADELVQATYPRVIQAMKHWVDPVSKEWWLRAWKTVGTAGSPNPPVGGPYTKKVSLQIINKQTGAG